MFGREGVKNLETPGIKVLVPLAWEFIIMELECLRDVYAEDVLDKVVCVRDTWVKEVWYLRCHLCYFEFFQSLPKPRRR